jgi:hypothetical protein
MSPGTENEGEGAQELGGLELDYLSNRNLMELEIQNIAFTHAAAAAEEGEFSDHDEDLCTESSWDPNEDNPEEVIPDLK